MNDLEKISIIIESAERSFNEALKRLCPIGSTVQWWTNGARKTKQTGKVIVHGYYNQIRVYNYKTKTKRWIGAYWLILK